MWKGNTLITVNSGIAVSDKANIISLGALSASNPGDRTHVRYSPDGKSCLVGWSFGSAPSTDKLGFSPGTFSNKTRAQALALAKTWDSEVKDGD